MSAEYPVSQLEDMARTLRAGTALLSEVDDAADMIQYLAERIKADEAKALGTCPKHGVEYVGECSGCAMTLPEKDFTHPPAQVAQVDAFTPDWAGYRQGLMDGRGELVDGAARGQSLGMVVYHDDEAQAAALEGRRVLIVADDSIAATADRIEPTAEPVAQTVPDAALPYESALASLIEAVDPHIESGDILADAHAAAMVALKRREPVAQGEVYLAGDAEEVAESLSDDAELVRRKLGPDNEVSENMERAAEILRTAAKPRAVPDVKAMADRLMGWRLPDDFAPDAGISFIKPTNPEWWPTGTNLFTVDQAEQMFRYVLAAAPSPGESS